MPLFQISELKDDNWVNNIFYNPTSQYSFEPSKHSPINLIKMYRYEYSHPSLPPSLFTSINGKKFIIPTWQEVLPETTLNDINWIKPKTNTIVEKNVFKFKSKSDPNIEYIVRQIGDKFKCNCPGSWRAKNKECKHIQELKSK